MTPKDIAAALDAEFVILHRAGCTPATPEYVADFIAREQRQTRVVSRGDAYTVAMRRLNAADSGTPPAKQWCAACGKFSDHGSATCPTITH